ncbi:hypothetical protein AGLY_011506 [Aphis glycines]|uniref:YqaJ viral recombinase domain-containing protein n=1 Tax=Aphis glycines TaxID=307491 RepID=A0A6G0TBX3_APHGL|nr:hypothetical protein AGLY_011506 [Aphis glycines]
MKEKYDLQHRVLDKFAKCVQIRHAKIQYIIYFTPQVLIDPNDPYLAASLDGLIENEAVVEIKCPYVAKDTTSAIEAVNNKLLHYCSLVNNKIKLKTEHAYYYQIMGQFHISRRKLCYFVVHTNNWTNIEKIKYISTFWESKMVHKLRAFYLQCLLSEIVQPLYPTRMLKSDIRERDTIVI